MVLRALILAVLVCAWLTPAARGMDASGSSNERFQDFSVCEVALAARTRVGEPFELGEAETFSAVPIAAASEAALLEVEAGASPPSAPVRFPVNLTARHSAQPRAPPRG